MSTVAADQVVIASRQLHLRDNIPGHLLALERRSIIGPGRSLLREVVTVHPFEVVGGSSGYADVEVYQVVSESFAID